jgi:hypothetical protein
MKKNTFVLFPIISLFLVSCIPVPVLQNRADKIEINGAFSLVIKPDKAFTFIAPVQFIQDNEHTITAGIYGTVQDKEVQQVLIAQHEQVASTLDEDFFLPLGDHVAVQGEEFRADEVCIGTVLAKKVILPEDATAYSKAVEGKGLRFPKEALTRRFYKLASDKKSLAVILYTEDLSKYGRTCQEFNDRTGITKAEWKQLQNDFNQRALTSWTL